MTAATRMWQMDRNRVIAVAGIGVSVLAVLANVGFFFGAGVGEVLRGAAYSAFVLGWMLLLTARSRTVSLTTLGIYFLLGVWAVTSLGYLLQDGFIRLVGGERTDEWVATWLASFTEEGLKALAVVGFYVLATRDGRRWPSISDGMMLGLVVGAGLKFHEDAHIGIVTGHGWSSETSLSTVLPTIEAYVGYVYTDHAVRGALEGLGVGAAAMLWHWRPARLIGLAGVFVMFWGHVMWNHFVDNPSEDVPAFYAALRAVLANGMVPAWLLLAGAIAAVLAELMVLRWVGTRDRVFPPLPAKRLFDLAKRANTKAGLLQLMAADRYLRLRRSVYYAAWRTRQAGGYPDVADADTAALMWLASQLGLRRSPSPPS